MIKRYEKGVGDGLPIVLGLLALFFLLFSDSSFGSSCNIFRLDETSKFDNRLPCDDKYPGPDISFYDNPSHAGKLSVDLQRLPGFPFQRLVKGNPATNKLQLELYKKSGIYALAYSGPLSPRVLEVLVEIFSSKIGDSLRRSLTRLKYFFTFRSMARNHASGLYLEPIDAIALHSHLSEMSSEEVMDTIAHELGHALLFSKFSPTEFSMFANRHGGWRLKAAESFYDAQYLTKFSGVNETDAFPSSYAYMNSHEWFAENFSRYLMSKLNQAKPCNIKIVRYFDQLLGPS